MTYSDTLARLRAISQTPTDPTDKTDGTPAAKCQTPKGPTDKTDKSPSVSSGSAPPGHSRNEQGTDIAADVAGRVAAVAPRGLGRWAGAWAMVEQPSVEFLDALHAWEVAVDPPATDEVILLATVHHTADRVVAAWSRAVEAWERAGRPGSEAREAGQ
jgi:hypothetical protein